MSVRQAASCSVEIFNGIGEIVHVSGRLATDTFLATAAAIALLDKTATHAHLRLRLRALHSTKFVSLDHSCPWYKTCAPAAG